jgi:D-inositol-3-phosphate glycosyltransferase
LTIDNADVRRVALISVHGCPMMRPGMRAAGGMNVYLKYLVESLGDQGICADLFTRNHEPDGPQVITLGPRARVIHIPAGPELTPKEDIYYHLPEFLQGLGEFLEREELSYDLVHSHYWLSGWVGCQVARAWDVPHVSTFHTMSLVKRLTFEAQEPPIRESIEREVASQSDLVVAFSEEERALLQSAYGVAADQVRVTTEGVDLGLFSPRNKQEARKHLGLEPDTPTILYVGRLEAFKGTHVLLRAMARLRDVPNLRLVVVGGGGNEDPEASALHQLAEEMGVAGRVLWQYAVPQEALPDYYAAADVCAVPSYHESFGLVALEAMACGTPVVAASVGGLRSLVVDGVTGLLVDPNTPELFAQRLQTVLDDPAMQSSMSIAAHQRAALFPWSTAASEVASAYRQVMTRTGHIPTAVPCAG